MKTALTFKNSCKANQYAAYRQLDPARVINTVSLLQKRIAERFPDSSLAALASEACLVATETSGRIHWIQKPHIMLRLAIGSLLCAIIGLVTFGFFSFSFVNFQFSKLQEFGNFMQGFDACISSLFFLGASIIFLFSWEARIKRKRAITAIHELRAMAHIVDMHQLTKDPISLSSTSTESSPKRTLSPEELGRYLDYCSELLSLIGKTAALYAQSIADSVVLNAVDDVEDLTIELSQKIWQKINMLPKPSSNNLL